MDVLDIAAGGGHTANALALFVRSVTAYDLTEEMLTTAAEFIRGNGCTNVKFMKGDAKKLPFSDTAFNLVPYRIAALRVLKPGGRLVLVDHTVPENQKFDQFYNDIEKERDPGHWREQAIGLKRSFVFQNHFTFPTESSGLSDEKTA
ncbi:methyltransferase domain-containing protein [Pseudomonas sp. ISL-88]|nr:methyltransferase domain-containing protein [Pseudomonas sp. ISL-88]